MSKMSKFLTIDQNYHNGITFISLASRSVSTYQVMYACSMARVGNIDIRFPLTWTDCSFSCHLASATEREKTNWVHFSKSAVIYFVKYNIFISATFHMVVRKSSCLAAKLINRNHLWITKLATWHCWLDYHRTSEMYNISSKINSDSFCHKKAI